MSTLAATAFRFADFELCSGDPISWVPYAGWGARGGQLISEGIARSPLRDADRPSGLAVLTCQIILSLTA